MEQETKIDLGSFNIASYLDQNFIFVASTSVTLRLPKEHAPAIRTARELRDHVKQGKIWVTQANSCQLHLRLPFESGHSFRQGIEAILLAAFEACPVWQTVGLQLHRRIETNYFVPNSDTLRTYHLQHSSKHSALITPEGVPCVYISTWHCDLSFGAGTSPTNATETKAITSTRLSKIITLKVEPKRLRRFAVRRRPWEQIPIKKQKREPGYKQKSESLTHWTEDAMASEGPDFFLLPTQLQNERLKHLIHAALSSILGLRRRFADMRVQPLQALSLIDIAPAIFNSSYLQGIVTRIQSASLISSALSNLSSTQSPILRRKISSFQQHPTTNPHSILEVMHGSITSLILRSTPMSKFSIPTKKTADFSDFPKEDTICDEQVQKIGQSFMHYYADDDVDIDIDCETDDLYGNNYLASNGVQWSDDRFAIPDPWPTRCNSREFNSNDGEIATEYPSIDEHSDSKILESAIESYDAGFRSGAQLVSSEIEDRYHDGIAPPYLAPGMSAPGSHQGSADLEGMNGIEHDEATDAHVMSAHYGAGDSHFLTAPRWAEYLLPEPTSADFRDTRELYRDCDYAVGNAVSTFHSYGCEDDDIDSIACGYTINGHTDDIFNHEGMCHGNYDTSIEDKERNFEDGWVDEKHGVFEEDFGISSHIGAIDSTCTLEGICDPRDHLQAFQSPCSMDSTGRRVVAHVGELGI